MNKRRCVPGSLQPLWPLEGPQSGTVHVPDTYQLASQSNRALVTLGRKLCVRLGCGGATLSRRRTEPAAVFRWVQPGAPS